MKFLVFLFLAALAAATQAQILPQAPTVAARSWLLMDYSTGQALASYNPDERVEPASLTKLMTAYVVLGALKEKKLEPTQAVPVSERAWKAPGSRMFIEPKRPVTVDELLHGLVIQSGNDACIALAEAVGGSEEAFVQMMNSEAQRLGLKGTRFANSTGLSDPQHYSTARELARLAAALIRDYPEHYALYAQREYTYNRITQANRNRLLWTDPAVDGVKTGHTENAGYCLVGSARRGSRRLISVVMGAASDGLRTQESQKLLNFGFQFFDAVKLYGKEQPVSQLKVWKGVQNTVKAGFLEDFTLSLPKGMADKVQASLVSRQPLMAPVQKGRTVATLKLAIDDRPIGEYPVVALENVPVAGIFGRAWDTVRLWLE
ncbi:MAG: D-alanyl-D-alanine carboxypeptidase DacC [Rhodocyclaceae bacterium]|nr:MAG: D-alanyl-D-alanine carboxypeptidase [Rhodocyclaceae bacterium]MBE7423171.1 D-alanyl-D-alanine carboxypeptidase [Zoogloeaceae bacterium]MBV6406750.1 D-alanyl-D-alanine carboxypeptidase DacC [Rhodocyclaceae bacterium]MCC6878872.1 D-alanyl-D-alanine carboxypeptidase [Rhodocyclaceae bacterium]MCK6384586.1 D-alanyl-D-alanine carboxypeptidase [Rhodocyclaceae bacterium]